MKAQRNFFLRITLVLVLFISTALTASAATARGRIVHSSGYPAGGIAVTLYNQQFGRTSPWYSDGNGMYYFTVPQGQYYLEIWINPGGQPLVYPIQIMEPGTDIPQVAIP